MEIATIGRVRFVLRYFDPRRSLHFFVVAMSSTRFLAVRKSLHRWLVSFFRYGFSQMADIKAVRRRMAPPNPTIHRFRGCVRSPPLVMRRGGSQRRFEQSVSLPTIDHAGHEFQSLGCLFALI